MNLCSNILNSAFVEGLMAFNTISQMVQVHGVPLGLKVVRLGGAEQGGERSIFKTKLNSVFLFILLGIN